MTPSRVVVLGPADARSLAAVHAPDSLRPLSGVDTLRSPPVEHLVSGLLAAGTAVDLVTCSPTIAAPVIARSEALSIFVAPYRPSGRGRDGFRTERRWLAALLRQTTGALVHAHWTYEFGLATLADPRPRVVTVHDAPLTVLRHMPHPYRVVRFGMAVRLRASPFTGIAVSPYLAGRWRAQLLDRRPLHVVPNAVVVSSGARFGGRRPGRVAAVADASRRKNVSALLEATAILRRDVAHAHLVVAGRGLGPADPLAQRARRAGLSEGVEWRGPISHADALALIASCEAFVHPSLEESFGMAVAEAMALGVPVVAGADSGAIPWVLDGGAAGLLVDVASPRAVAAGVARVLTDPALAAGLRMRALDRVAEFSRDAVVERHLDLYDAVMDSGAAGRRGTAWDRTRRRGVGSQ